MSLSVSKGNRLTDRNNEVEQIQRVRPLSALCVPCRSLSLAILISTGASYTAAIRRKWGDEDRTGAGAAVTAAE